MSGIPRTLPVLMISMIGMISMAGPIACLKPNPLLELELGGDGDTDTGTTDDAIPDVLDTSGSCESPPPEIEVECAACLSESCCTSFGPCGEDPICVCETACLFAGEKQATCRNLCGAQAPDDPAPLAPLLLCAQLDCPACFVP